MSTPPTALLTTTLREAIGGGSLRAAVMTTFTLDWAFVLDHLLPAFVPHSLSPRDNARREELADHLLQNDACITVYADHNYIGGQAGSTRVPLSVVPVDHRTGIFHPKVIMALVESDGIERLVVSAASANLTRQGWWEWVECAQVITIEAAEHTWLRDDLLSFLAYLEGQSRYSGDRIAPRRVRAFLEATTQRVRRSEADDQGMARFIWNGSTERADFVTAVAKVANGQFAGGRLEVVTPWYSNTGDSVLRKMHERLEVETTVAFVPEDADGAALVPREAVARLEYDVEWGTLRRHILSAGPAAAAPRHVHAKLYRLTQYRGHEQAIIAGSFNLTDSAFSATGNIEAALYMDLPKGGRDPWLEVQDPPTTFQSPQDEDDAAEIQRSTQSSLTLSFDWSEQQAASRWAPGRAPETVVLMQGALTVATLSTVEISGPLNPENTIKLATLLRSSSPFLDVVGIEGEDLGYTIVRELDVNQKPSPDVDRRVADALADLLLSAEARRNRRSVALGDDPSESEGGHDDQVDDELSVFDSYAALYQAMDRFRLNLLELVAADKTAEIRYRLTGGGARCLGDVLNTAERAAPDDPSMSLVVCWAIEDVLTVLRAQFKGFDREMKRTRARTATLRRQTEHRVLASAEGDPEMKKFLAWARDNFVRQTP